MYGTEAFVKTPHAESWGRERSDVDYEEMVDNMWQELGISVSSLGFTNQGAPTPTRLETLLRLLRPAVPA